MIKIKEKVPTWEDFKKDPEVKQLKTLIRVILMVALFMISFTLFASIFGRAQPQISQSSNNLEYNFSTDNLFNSTGLGRQRWWDNSSNTFNLKNIEEYSENYNASYSFTNETVGTNGTNIIFLTSDSSHINTGAIILDNLTGHNRVIEFFDNNNTGVLDYLSEFNGQVSGTYEWFWKTTDITKGNQMIFREGATRGPRIQIDSSNFQYYSGGFINIRSATNDIWYHIRLDFECGAGGYLGLATDTFFITINGMQYGAYPFNTPTVELDNIWITSITVDIGYSFYIDAFGDSRLSNYTIGDNLIPLSNITTDIYEPDSWWFQNNPYTRTHYVDGFDNPAGWNDWLDIPPLVDNVNILNIGWKPGEPNWGYQRWAVVHVEDSGGLVRNFNGINDNIYNITFNFEINQIDPGDVSANAIQLSIRDSDDINFITALHIKHDGTITLSYDEANNVIGVIGDITNNFTVNFFLDINSRKQHFTMMYWDNHSIIYDLTVPFYNIVADDIDRILFSHVATSAVVDSYLFGVSIYGNNGSITDAIGELIWYDIGYPKLGIFGEWFLNQYNLMDLYGNFNNVSIFRNEFGGLVDHVFMDWSEVNTYKFTNIYDDTYHQSPFDRIKLWMYGNFTFDSISIDGSILTQDTNIYYLTFTNSTGMNIQESYFYVSGNKLYYTLTTYDNDLEYIRAEFLIGSQVSTNYTLLYGGIKDYASLEAVMRLHYLDTTYSFFELTVFGVYRNVIIPQGHSIDSFQFLITDNDNDVDFTISGYFNSFELVNTIGIGFTIIVSDYLSILTPILLISIISITIWQLTRKKVQNMLAAPSMILMSFSVFAMGFIPIWILFIMLIGSAVLMYTKWEDNLAKFASFATMGTSFLSYANIIPFWLFYISFMILIGYLIFGLRKTIRG